MRFRRAISVLTLAAFLPLAVGCSTRTTWPIHSDPGDENPDAKVLELGAQPIEIVGYTDRKGGHHLWEGEVRAVQPDSLEFRRKVRDESGGWFSSRTQLKRLARADVRSIDRKAISGWRTTVLVLGVSVVVLTAAAALTIALNPPMEGFMED